VASILALLVWSVVFAGSVLMALATYRGFGLCWVVVAVVALHEIKHVR